MTEGLAQAGDGCVEGPRGQVGRRGVDGAGQAAGPPRLNLGLPEGLAAGLRRLAGRGSGWFATSRREGDRFGGRDDVLVVAQARGGAGRGPAFGRKVAHLALDDARIVPAALSRDGEDLNRVQ